MLLGRAQRRPGVGIADDAILVVDGRRDAALVAEVRDATAAEVDHPGHAVTVEGPLGGTRRPVRRTDDESVLVDVVRLRAVRLDIARRAQDAVHDIAVEHEADLSRVAIAVQGGGD
ncbi:hypothetical protein LDC_0961 [sediment metagenome]|uniref:Uncharacterized protein n=1 Tax=sediment metagenome TaxID=749907 RepID=D9PHG1_9ZZZZ